MNLSEFQLLKVVYVHSQPLGECKKELKEVATHEEAVFIITIDETCTRYLAFEQPLELTHTELLKIALTLGELVNLQLFDNAYQWRIDQIDFKYNDVQYGPSICRAAIPLSLWEQAAKRQFQINDRMLSLSVEPPR